MSAGGGADIEAPSYGTLPSQCGDNHGYPHAGGLLIGHDPKNRPMAQAPASAAFGHDTSLPLHPDALRGRTPPRRRRTHGSPPHRCLAPVQSIHWASSFLRNAVHGSGSSH